MMAGKKYYWLKLQRDFFKRHDIRIIENMPNGKDYLLFYLKLLCESIDHEGNLRFSDQIPYNEDMLSTITNTNVDVVRSAIKVFTSLNMMEVMDDGTFYMREVEKMIGISSQDEHTKESTRLRVKAFRERQKQALIEQERYSNVTCNGEKELDIEKEIEVDIEIDKDININNIKRKDLSKDKSKREIFKPPTVDEVKEYCLERGNNIDPETFIDFYESKGWMVGKNKMKDWKAAVRTWEKNRTNNPAKSSDYMDAIKNRVNVVDDWV